MGIRKIIKESLSDFDWVGETDGLRNEKPKKGDTINVVYNGPRDQSAKNFFLAILGKYRRPFKLGVFGENIRGEVIDIGSEGYVLKEINTGYEIYIPSPEHIEKQKEKAKRRVQKRGIPKLNFKFDFEFYHIIEPNSEPSVNESDDFDWVRDINPIPNEILNISKYREGNYKFWLGDISKETQLQILDYISEVIRNNDNLHTNGTLYEVRKRVEKNLVSINSLFFEVKQVDLTKGINLSIMGWYPNDPHFEREERLEYCRNYFYQTDDINLSDVDLGILGDINEKFNMKLNKKTIKRILREEFNDFDWIKDTGDNKYVHVKVILSKVDETYYEENPNEILEYENVFRVPLEDFVRITNSTEFEDEEYEIITPIGHNLLNYAYDCELNPDVCKGIEYFFQTDDGESIEGVLLLNDNF